MSGPFVIGKRYRVRKSFEALRDTFTEGDVLIYDSTAYSRYDGITGYFFVKEGSTKMQWWDIPDYEDLNVWKELFEPLPDATTETAIPAA